MATPFVLPLPAAISAAPDTDAFLAGFQLVLGVVFLVIVGLIGVSLIRKAIGV